ncbi:unnamed protein product [Ectocarpus fasciculatus]
MLRRADAATAAAARWSFAKQGVTAVAARCLSQRLRHPQGFPAVPSSARGDGRRCSSSSSSSSSSSTSPIDFAAPPEDLEDGYFERPTPLLLVAGEGQPAAWWKDTASFLASRGCTVGTMTLTGRGSSPTDTLTLRALQAGVAAAVEKSGLTPPVIVAHSMAGFVCQQYLQSYSASGLVLLDSFPPSPGTLANEHLLRARAGDPGEANDPAGPSPSLGAQELAQLMKDDPAHWEGLLRRYFSEFHQQSPWHNAPMPCPRHDLKRGVIKEENRHSISSCTSPDPRFPVKAFAQMCLSETSSTLRLESHVVETLVLGSSLATSATNSSSPGGRGGTDGVAALDRARRDGLSAICEFHGTDGWREVDHRGVVADGVDMPENSPPWQEVVWEWYDARF